jgi:hypothetical protein
MLNRHNENLKNTILCKEKIPRYWSVCLTIIDVKGEIFVDENVGDLT